MEKQTINYPCPWSFRIIGRDEKLMKNAVAECLRQTQYLLTASHTSRSGKYVSLNLETVVADETDRNRIYIDLKNQSCVTLVL